jgi:hypothetical protein
MNNKIVQGVAGTEKAEADCGTQDAPREALVGFRL